jgi:heptosyltransferase-2
MWANAAEKLGFGLSEFGTVFPLNPEAEYAFQLGLDDELKFKRNRKTYQEVLFEAIRLPYAKEEYSIQIDERDRSHADDLLKQWKIAPLDVIIGLNLGGGSAFAHKMWNVSCATAFLDALLKERPCKVMLFGAERERKVIEQLLAAGRPNVLSAGTGNSIRQFQALLARCAVVVTGDSLGMHLAIAEKRPVVALFGPTCAQEIELYGRGEVLTAASPCAPCYRPECLRNPTCMQAIEPGPVVAAVKRWLNGARQG